MASSAGLFADFRREEEDRQEPSQGTMGLFLWLLLAVITIPIIHAETLNRPHRSRVVTERPFRRAHLFHKTYLVPAGTIKRSGRAHKDRFQREPTMSTETGEPEAGREAGRVVREPR